MNKRNVLTQAAELVDKGWTQNLSARDKNGNWKSPIDPCAVKFCATGAVRRIIGKNKYVMDYLYTYSEWLFFNDRKTTKKEEVVLALLFEAYLPK